MTRTIDPVLHQYILTVVRGFSAYAYQQYELVPDQNYQVSRIVNGPRILTLDVGINPADYKKLRGTEHEFSMAMGLPEEASIRFKRGRGSEMRVEIPKPKNLVFDVYASQLPHHGQSWTSTIGIDTKLAPVTIDFRDSGQAHVLIAGQTGSGKTFLQKMVVVGLALSSDPSEVRFFIVDVAKRGLHWKDLEIKDHIGGSVAVELDDAVALTKFFVREVNKRVADELVPPRVPHYFLVVDELSTLMESEHEGILQKGFGHISKIGREYGVHLLFSTQYPLVGNTGGSETKQQFGVRLVGHLSDGIAAKVAAGMENSGAHYLTGKGDFVRVAEGAVVRFQAALPYDAKGHVVVGGLPEGSNGKFKLPLEVILGISNGDLAKEVRSSTLPPKVGRPVDDLNLSVVSQLAVKATKIDRPPQSWHTVGSWISPRMSAGKARRHWEAAITLLKNLRQEGYWLAPI